MQAGREQREPSPGIAAGKIDGDQRIAEPSEPFEEIIRMPRPAPQSGLANPATLRCGAAKAPQLSVGERLAGDRNE